MPRYLMHLCKNWGEKDCHSDVKTHFLAKQIGEGDPTPIWPSDEEQKRLDQICKDCEYFEGEE